MERKPARLPSGGWASDSGGPASEEIYGTGLREESPTFGMAFSLTGTNEAAGLIAAPPSLFLADSGHYLAEPRLGQQTVLTLRLFPLAEERITVSALEPRHDPSRRHLERLQDASRSGIDSPHIALVTLRVGMPVATGAAGSAP